MKLFRFFLLVGFLFGASLWGSSSPSKLSWQSWDADLFKRAAKEKKLVLLDLEAIWCHWCHVMDEETYQDPAVVKILSEKYIVVKVDQDSRPDISLRYEDYGWPATILFRWDGVELAKRSGYIPPKKMVSMLQTFVDDPTPGPSAVSEETMTYAKDSNIDKKALQGLEKTYTEHYDKKYGSWGRIHKLLSAENIEYALSQSVTDNKEKTKMARFTLTEAMKILDPVWGGMYQYSTGGNWNEPHFEKIMQIQGDAMRLYALGHQLYSDPAYLNAAKSVAGYLQKFLLDKDGAFYTSQDADLVQGQHADGFFKLNDTKRRAKGMPRIDKNIYARENGWAISGLTRIYDTTQDETYLNMARKSADWILKNRSLPEGGFSHGEKDAAGPFMADSLYMGKALLDLYTSTAERSFIDKAQTTLKFIDKKFKDPKGGYLSAVSDLGGGLKVLPQRDDNIALIRFANIMFYYTGDKSYQEIAKHAMLFVASPSMVELLPVGGTLLANSELKTEPLHITIVGKKNDPNARALFTEALRYPALYRRVEWWDKSEGKLPNSDVSYPELNQAAAFVCTGNRCSFPIKQAKDLAEKVRKLR